MALINKNTLKRAHVSAESETKEPDTFSYWFSVNSYTELFKNVPTLNHLPDIDPSILDYHKIDSELLESYAGIKAQDCSVPEEYWSSYEVDRCCKTN